MRGQKISNFLYKKERGFLMKRLYILTLIVIMVAVLSHFAFSAMPIIKVNETDLVNIKVTAADLNKDQLKYTYSKPLNSSGQWQTGYGDEGEYLVNVTVSDGKIKTTQKILLVVNRANGPPAVEDIHDIEISEGDSIKVNVKAKDEENDPLTIIFSSPLNSNGVWNTTYKDAGNYEMSISVSDKTHTVKKKFFVKVKNVNRKPYFTSYIPKSGAADEEEKSENLILSKEDKQGKKTEYLCQTIYSTETDSVKMKENEASYFVVSAKDPDGDKLSYSWELDGKEQDEDSNEFEYQTDYDSAGKHTIKVTVSDNQSFISKKWNINVENVNRAPVLEDISDISVNENETVILNINASDPDGDKILYHISEPIGDDKEWKTTYDDAGVYIVNVTVSDGDIKVTRKVKITVKDVDRAPYFQKLNDVSINETDTVKVKFNAEDPDGDKVTYTAEGLPDGAYLKDNELSYSSSYDVVKKPNRLSTRLLELTHLDWIYYTKKDFKIKIIAKGKDFSSSQDFKLTVNNIDRPPKLLPISPITINETQAIKIVPEAVDQDNNKVYFSFSGGKIRKNGVWKTDYDSSGDYIIKVIASDAKGLWDSQDVYVKVNNVNRAPIIKDIKPAKIDERDTIKIKPAIVDFDGDKVELYKESAPSDSKVKNNTFEWTPDYDVASRGEDKEVIVTLGAKDIYDYTASADAKITVKNVNRAPIIYKVEPAKELSVYVGETVFFNPSVIDLDNDTLAYEWKEGWSTIAETPKIKRIFSNPGDKEITFEVSDGKIVKGYTWIVHVNERKVIPAPQPVKTVVYTPVPQPVIIKQEIQQPVQQPQPAKPESTVNTYLVEEYSYTIQKSPEPSQPVEQKDTNTNIYEIG